VPTISSLDSVPSREPNRERYRNSSPNAGKRKGRQWQGRKGHKEVVIGIRQRGGNLRFFHAADAKSGTLAKYIQENISTDVDVIVTDEWPAYPKAVGDLKHETVNHPGGASGGFPLYE